MPELIEELVKRGKECPVIAFYFPDNNAPAYADQVMRAAKSPAMTLKEVKEYVYKQLQNLSLDAARAVMKRVVDRYGPERGFVKAFCIFQPHSNAIIIANGIRNYDEDYDGRAYVFFDVSDDVINFAKKMWKNAQKLTWT